MNNPLQPDSLTPVDNALVQGGFFHFDAMLRATKLEASMFESQVFNEFKCFRPRASKRDGVYTFWVAVQHAPFAAEPMTSDTLLTITPFRLFIDNNGVRGEWKPLVTGAIDIKPCECKEVTLVPDQPKVMLAIMKLDFMASDENYKKFQEMLDEPDFWSIPFSVTVQLANTTQ